VIRFTVGEGGLSIFGGAFLLGLDADSDEAARVYRALSAHRSNLMAPTILI